MINKDNAIKVMERGNNAANKIANFAKSRIFNKNIKDKYKPVGHGYRRSEIEQASIISRPIQKQEKWEKDLIELVNNFNIDGDKLLAVHFTLKNGTDGYVNDMRRLLSVIVSDDKWNVLLKQIFSYEGICTPILSKSDNQNNIGCLFSAMSGNNTEAIDLFFEKAKEGYFDITDSYKGYQSIFGYALSKASTRNGLETFKYIVNKISELPDKKIEKMLAHDANNEYTWDTIMKNLGFEGDSREPQINSKDRDKENNYIEAIKFFCESKLSKHLVFKFKESFGGEVDESGRVYYERLVTKFKQMYDMSNPEQKKIAMDYIDKLRYEDGKFSMKRIWEFLKFKR